MNAPWTLIVLFVCGGFLSACDKLPKQPPTPTMTQPAGTPSAADPSVPSATSVFAPGNDTKADPALAKRTAPESPRRSPTPSSCPGRTTITRRRSPRRGEPHTFLPERPMSPYPSSRRPIGRQVATPPLGAKAPRLNPALRCPTNATNPSTPPPRRPIRKWCRPSETSRPARSTPTCTRPLAWTHSAAPKWSPDLAESHHRRALDTGSTGHPQKPPVPSGAGGFFCSQSRP